MAISAQKKLKKSSQVKLIFVYWTAKDLAEARRVSRALLDDNLVGCVNLFPQMESHYRWKGKIEKSHEVAVIAKTQRKLLIQVTSQIKALHSYSVPCVLAFDVWPGNADYAQWLKTETDDAILIAKKK